MSALPLQKFQPDLDSVTYDLDALLGANPTEFLRRTKILKHSLSHGRQYSYYADWPQEHVQALLFYLRVKEPVARREVAAQKRAKAARAAAEAKAQADAERASTVQSVNKASFQVVEKVHHPVQASLFDDEEMTYHDVNRSGFFSILQVKGGAKRQSTFKLAQLPQVIPLLDKTTDTWIGQGEFFKPNRRVVNLARLGLCFTDLDTYSVGITGKPETLARMLEVRCVDLGIPPPSIVVFSGRGLQAKWLFDGTIPAAALPRWNLCQHILVDQLSTFGADPKSKDASRVLRLTGAVNSKSGEVARVVHVREVNGEPVRYSFEAICDRLLPFHRQEIELKRAERKAKNAADHQIVVLPGGRKIEGLKRFTGRQLAWHRLLDLRKIAELRGGVKEGERMEHLFWQINFLLLAGATNANQMWHEAAELARSIDPQWHYDKSDLSTLYEKAKAFGKGEKIEFNGRLYPALYTPKNDHLINLFGITDEEQRKLKTIITPSLARERHAERERIRRKNAGAQSRSEYLANSKSATKPWESEGISRRTWYRRNAKKAGTQH
ncbi:replication protein [Vreelandella populi]|uniref:replication protein n=1 Tax=Vreelandella populi TaxID=2498858 RepID=UPI000F8CFA75|nr:replication protein [Halomonas populi]RUR51955.1 replication protein [Halomonas populi]